MLDNFEDDENAIVKIDGEFAEKLANKIIKKSKKVGVETPILLVPMDYRQIFFSLLSLYLNNIVVIAHEEIGVNAKVEVVSEI